MDHSLMFIGISSWIYTILAIGYAVTILSCIIIILSENRNPIKSLAWVTVLIFLPVVGLIFYIFFGRDLKGTHIQLKHSKRTLKQKLGGQEVNLIETNLKEANKQIIKLADTTGNPMLSTGNAIEIFTSGEEKFEALKKDLRAAQHYICLQYYIFTDDKIGHEIADILIDRARHGVKVLVIYDHVGSFSVKNNFFRRLRREGIDAQPFLKVTFPQLANRLNWRNHRKIVVIDSKVGYIGGMNIADRYVAGDKGNKAWRDTHFRVKGSVINSLLFSFISDWSYMKRPLIEQANFHVAEPLETDLDIQLITSGPDGRWPNIAMAYQKAISGARKSIYIQTPYFLPTDALLKALQAAALAKVDVRIMMPRRSDSSLLNYASFSYITQCLKAGIKIYLYEDRMIHSKVMIIDDDLVTTGSANFDFRSFEHNFEVNMFVFGESFNRAMRDIFFNDVKHCTKLTFKRWHKRPLTQKALESLLRLVSPIL